MTIHINRVYTRTGDSGDTGLVGGERVAKDSPRIETYGTIDELNGFLGLARALLSREKADAEVDGILARLQNELFNLGTAFATPPEKLAGMPLVSSEDIERMEGEMDRFTAELEPLRSFVLPGGGAAGAALHVARTVCRRAERAAVSLAREAPVRPEDLAYLNRTSDLLFVLSRIVAKRLGCAETLWKEGLPRGEKEKA